MGIFSITFDLGFKTWSSICSVDIWVTSFVNFERNDILYWDGKNMEKVLTMTIIVLTIVPNNQMQHQLHFMSGKELN